MLRIRCELQDLEAEPSVSLVIPRHEVLRDPRAVLALLDIGKRFARVLFLGNQHSVVTRAA